jgi:16S rRNA (uracil1498-N3)-methyltransferase
MSSAPRFFVTLGDIQGDSVILPPDAAHHARNVLRLQPGQTIHVLPSDGTALACTLTDVSKTVVAHVDERFSPGTEPETKVTVTQALPKTAEKIEQVLQHGTEIGAARFVVFGAKRSVARLEGNEKIAKREERWRGIVQGAAEQSGRGVLPPVDWFRLGARYLLPCSEQDAVFVLHESAAAPLRDALRPLPDAAHRLMIIVGPEGGLTDEEVSHFQSEGAQVVTLGPRILRTETAALVALSQILFARGD